MAVLRRRSRRRDEADGGGAVLDLPSVAEAIRSAVAADLDSGPEPVLAGAGPNAYSFALATDDPRWTGTLVARVSSPAVLAREAGWIGALAGAGYPVPSIVADRNADGVVVFRPPAGINLTSAMVDDFMSVPKFLAAFGQLHARLHDLDPDLLPGGDDVDPLDELLERASSEDVRAAVDDELVWLDKNRPDPAARPAVPCHGDLNPVHVYVADGDPTTAVPVNWARARRAEAAYDVAGTVTAFWTGPLYVDGTVQRTALKMIRDSLISAYLKAYGEAAAGGPLDDEALRYWQAFHVAALAVDLARRLHGQPPGPWDPATNVVKPADALADLHAHFHDLTTP